MNAKIQKIKLSDKQQQALNAIINYNNYFLFAESADGNVLSVGHGDSRVLSVGLRNLAKDKEILDIMTNIVIDAQNGKI